MPNGTGRQAMRSRISARVKLYKDLIAEPSQAALPERSTPLASRRLLLRLPLVECVDEDVRVNEDRRGHGPLRGSSRARPRNERPSLARLRRVGSRKFLEGF